MLAICLIIPGVFALVGCDSKPKVATITFDVSITFNQEWQVNEQTNTYTVDYVNSFYWDPKFIFSVNAVFKNGDTDSLLPATSNTYGYKVETNMPTGLTIEDRLPVGTYTYKLYCEEYENKGVKVEACESETYTIIVTKTTIDWSNYGWAYLRQGPNFASVGFTILDFDAPYPEFMGSNEHFFDIEYEFVNDTNYYCDANEPGSHTAKVIFDLDMNNYNHINLPAETFEYTVDAE